MADIPKYVRIFSPDPDDDFVSKRTTAINAIETNLRKKVNSTQLYQVANAIVRAGNNPSTCPSEITELASSALRKASSSFVTEGQDLQLNVCVLLSCLQFFEKATQTHKFTAADISFAICLLNGLTFSNPTGDFEKFGDLRKELVELCKTLTADLLRESRIRSEIDELPTISVPADNSFVSFANTLNSSFHAVVENLRLNAALDREELDMLWWVINGKSKIFKKALIDLSPVQAIVAGSLEMGSRLHTIPDEAFLELVCRGIDPLEEYDANSLKQHLEGFQDEIDVYASTNYRIKNCQDIFPVSSLLFEGVIGENPTQSRPLKEWAGRIMLEGAVSLAKNFLR